MVGVTQDTNGARLHHHSKSKIHGVPKPAFSESAEDVAMSNLKPVSTLQVTRRGKKERSLSVPARHPQHRYLACVVSVARIYSV